MMQNRLGKFVRVALPLSAGLLCACATREPASTVAMTTTGSTMVRSATVTDVRDVSVRGDKQPTGLGSFAGAILGGIAGSQIGGGNGSAAASIGGAVAGSMAGQHVEQSGGDIRNFTEVSVRFDNGEEHTYTVEPGENFRIGDTVRVTTHNSMTRVTH